MELVDILKMILSFLLRFAELIVSFVIGALGLFLDFFRALVGSVQ